MRVGWIVWCAATLTGCAPTVLLGENRDAGVDASSDAGATADAPAVDAPAADVPPALPTVAGSREVGALTVNGISQQVADRSVWVSGLSAFATTDRDASDGLSFETTIGDGRPVTTLMPPSEGCAGFFSPTGYYAGPWVADGAGAWLFFGKNCPDGDHGFGAARWSPPAARPELPTGGSVAGNPELLFAGTGFHVTTAFRVAEAGVEYVYAYDCLPAFAFSGQCRLGRVPLADAGRASAWTFWTGAADARWSSTYDRGSTSNIVFVSNTPDIDVSWNAYLRRYVSLEGDRGAPRVWYRTAPSPTGPWSAPAELFATRPVVGTNFIYGYAWSAHAHPEFDAEGGRRVYVSYSRPIEAMPAEHYLVEVEFARPVGGCGPVIADPPLDTASCGAPASVGGRVPYYQCTTTTVCPRGRYANSAARPGFRMTYLKITQPPSLASTPVLGTLNQALARGTLFWGMQFDRAAGTFRSGALRPDFARGSVGLGVMDGRFSFFRGDAPNGLSTALDPATGTVTASGDRIATGTSTAPALLPIYSDETATHMASLFTVGNVRITARPAAERGCIGGAQPSGGRYVETGGRWLTEDDCDEPYGTLRSELTLADATRITVTIGGIPTPLCNIVSGADCRTAPMTSWPRRPESTVSGQPAWVMVANFAAISADIAE